jgi:hypothetical protein
MDIIKESFDKTAIPLHAKIIRKLKGYLKVSQRDNNEKKILENLIKLYK